jgi:hypothetical protein
VSDPVTGIAGLALGGLQAGLSIVEGQQQAAVAAANTRLALQTASAEAARRHRENASLLAAQRARIGASGVTVQGSPVAVLRRSAADFALAEQEIVTRGLQQAAFERYRGETARTQGFIGAGQALLGAGMQYGPRLLQ